MYTVFIKSFKKEIINQGFSPTFDLALQRFASCNVHSGSAFSIEHLDKRRPEKLCMLLVWRAISVNWIL